MRDDFYHSEIFAKPSVTVRKEYVHKCEDCDTEFRNYTWNAKRCPTCRKTRESRKT